MFSHKKSPINIKTEHRAADLLEIHLVAELPTKVVNHKMKMAYKDNTDDHIRDDDGDREAVGPSVSAEYYLRGSVELATESALTLAKIQHVSSNTHLYGGRENNVAMLLLFVKNFRLSITPIPFAPRDSA